MTGATIRQAATGVDLMLRDELQALGQLISRWLPIRVVNLLLRPNESLRRAVTFETPFHIKCIHPPRDRHLIDTAMAGGTAESLCDMDAVIEINVIGQIVHTGPFQGHIRGKTFPHRREDRRIVKNLRMTSHARFAGGHAGEPRFLNGVMAVAAIDSVVANVMFVTEGNRLIKGYSDISSVRRPKNFRSRPASTANQNYRAKNNDP